MFDMGAPNSGSVQSRSDRGTFENVYDRAGLIEEICERLRLGEPLAAICRESHMPNYTVVYDWRNSDPLAAQQIADARLAGEQAIAARLRNVASGVEGYSSGDVQRDKLIIDTDFKLLAKWNPRVWGDNMQLRHADADGAKLDTGALVTELLGLMPGGSPTNAQPVIEARARNVTPAPAKPAYKPRIRPATDVDDLV